MFRIYFFFYSTGLNFNAASDRVKNSKLIVHGMVKSVNSGSVVSYEVDVMCVLKKSNSITKDIGTSITIHESKLKHKCASEEGLMNPKQSIIAILKEDGDKFYFDIINNEAPVFSDSKLVLNFLRSSCHLDDKPSGPKCAPTNKRLFCGFNKVQQEDVEDD